MIVYVVLEGEAKNYEFPAVCLGVFQSATKAQDAVDARRVQWEAEHPNQDFDEDSGLDVFWEVHNVE